MMYVEKRLEKRSAYYYKLDYYSLKKLNVVYYSFRSVLSIYSSIICVLGYPYFIDFLILP